MLEKFKEINKWRKMKKDFDELSQSVSVTYEKDGIEITMKGDKKIERISIDGDENRLIKDIINETMKQVDKKLEKAAKQNQGQLMEALGLK